MKKDEKLSRWIIFGPLLGIPLPLLTYFYLVLHIGFSVPLKDLIYPSAIFCAFVPIFSAGAFWGTRARSRGIFMRTPRSMEGARRHFAVFLLRILGAAFSISISLSVALKRPVRSFGAITDSRASSFTDGSARV